MFGSDGRLKLYNRAFSEMWELPQDLTAQHPHIDAVIRACRVLAPQDEPWVDLRGAVAGLADLRMGMDCRMDRRDGSVLECAAQPLPDGATLLTFIDVTASVSVARALTERNEALERASRLRDEFVHHVSYELRSPLTNVIGFAQLLGDETVGTLNPRQRDYADHILRSSGALLAILNDILDLASIDTGSLELSPEMVDIRSTIDAAMRGIEDRLAEASLTVDIDVPADIGSFVADGKRIRQILFNLLSNAVGFSSPGQSIRILARKREDEVLFEVKDEGRGIPPEVKARIFERFESHTLGTRHRGVGLGLSIVRSFVELHGGRIDLSRPPARAPRLPASSLMNGMNRPRMADRARMRYHRSPPNRFGRSPKRHDDDDRLDLMHAQDLIALRLDDPSGRSRGDGTFRPDPRRRTARGRSCHAVGGARRRQDDARPRAHPAFVRRSRPRGSKPHLHAHADL